MGYHVIYLMYVLVINLRIPWPWESRHRGWHMFSSWLSGRNFGALFEVLCVGWIDESEIIVCSPLLVALEWLFVACWGIVIWSIYVIIVERTYTSESMNPRPCFLSLQYRLRSLLSLVTSDYKYLYLPSMLHLYHHLFAELVHLYNLPLYWVCWGHKSLFVIWLQGCLRETIFILQLLRIDKP